MDFDFRQVSGPRMALGPTRQYAGTTRTLVVRKAGTYKLVATNVQTSEERNLETLGPDNTLTLTIVARYSGIYERGVPSLLFAVLLIGGIQLLALGMLGEYLGRIYDEVKQRPLYVISRSQNLDPEEGAAAALAGQPHACHHRRLVHIERGRALDDDIHPNLLTIGVDVVARQEPRLQSSLKGGLTGTSPGSRARLPRQTLNGLTGTKQNAAAASDARSIARFHPPWMAVRP